MYSEIDSLISQIKQQDELFNSPSSLPSLTFSVSGLRDKAQYLDKAVFRLAISIIINPIVLNPRIFMITASHNSKQYNGVKVGLSKDEAKKQFFKKVQNVLNNKAQFHLFISKYLPQHHNSTTEKRVWIGRDCRQSSIHFQSILKRAFDILSIKYFLMGQTTTPETFAFPYFYLSLKDQSSIEEARFLYHQTICQSFKQIYRKFNREKSQIKREKVCFDFGNGCGAISFKDYRELLSELFQFIEVNNKEFDRPNEKCGAEYIQKNPHQFKQQNYFGAPNIAFFDGDSDRIVCKFEFQQSLFDGNYFLACFSKSIQIIIASLITNWEKQKIGIEKIQLIAVGSILMNKGLLDYLQREKIQYQEGNVGIMNLFSIAEQSQMKEDGTIAVFFQPNGHGGIYFNQKMIKIMENEKNESEELDILKTINTVLKNNSKGYALHNFFIFKLLQRYLLSKEHKVSNLFKKTQAMEQIYSIHDSKFHLFQTKEQETQFCSPSPLIEEIQNLKKEFSESKIIMRKSNTERGKIRFLVEAKSVEQCKLIIDKIRKLLDPYLANTS